MTQQEFNAMLAVALSEGLGGGSYVHLFSGEEMDALLSLMGYEHGDPDLTGFLAAAQAAQTAAESAASNSSGSAQAAYENANAAAASAYSAGQSKTSAENSANYAAASSTQAESYAVGGTGTRTGEDTDNAKYWAEQAHQVAQDTLIDSVTAKEYSLVVSNGRLMLQEV